MKLNKLLLALPALLTLSFSNYAAEIPTNPFPPAVATPDVDAILNDPAYADDWQNVEKTMQSASQSKIVDNKYIHGQNITNNRPESLSPQRIYIRDNSYVLMSNVHAVQIDLESGSQAIGTTLSGLNNGTRDVKGVLAVKEGTVAYDTTINNLGSMGIRQDGKAYNTQINSGGIQVVSDNGYAQSTMVDGGEQEISLGSNAKAEDTILINGGTQYIYSGTAINTHVGNGSYQLTSGLAIDTYIYDGAVQSVYAGQNETDVADRNTTIYAGGRQYIQRGISEGAQVYGWQIISGVEGHWQDGSWVPADRIRTENPVAQDATIYAGGRQQVQTGTADGTQVYGLQVISGNKGTLENGQWINGDAWVGREPVATNSTVHTGGEQRINFFGHAEDTLINGGIQIVEDRGHVYNTTIQNNGSSTILYGGYSTGTMDVNDGSLTLQGGDDLHNWTGNLGKGAYAAQVNLNVQEANLFIQHNTDTLESAATIKNLVNNGVVTFGSKDGSDAGKYSQLNLNTLTGTGTFVMNTNIDGGQGDFLNITDSIDGNFNVKVMDSGVELGRSVDGLDPHHLIFAKDSQASHFVLVNGSVDLGAYKYYLVQGDTAAADTDNWYLSPTKISVDPEIPEGGGNDGDNNGTKPIPPHGGENGSNGGITPNPKPELSDGAKSVLAMANVTPTIWDGELSTLRTRLGDLRDNRTAQNGTWGKYITSRYRISTDNVGYKQDMNGVMLGADHAIEQDGSRLIIGGLFSYTHSDIDSHSGDGKVDSYALGVYTTWLSDTGYYVDSVLKANHFRTENNANFNGGKTSATDNTNGFGISIEAGKHIIFDSYFVEPYVMGSAFRGGKTEYKLDSGMKAKADSAESLKAETGTTFGKSFKLASGALIKPYGRIAISHEFKKNNDVIINDTERFSNDMSGTVGKYGIGLTAQLDNQWSTYTEVNYSKGNHIETPYSGNIGIRYSF